MVNFYLLYTRFFAKFFFGSCGKKLCIEKNVEIIKPKNLFVGNNVRLNSHVFLNCRGKIILEDKVVISPFVKINTGYLDFKTRKHLTDSVLIKENAWICTGAIINQGVIIGKNSIVGSGAVVTKDVPNDCFYAGNPAKLIKKLNIEE